MRSGTMEVNAEEALKGAEDADSDTYKGYASAEDGSSAGGSAAEEVKSGEVRLRGLVKRFSERNGWGLLAVIGATTEAADSPFVSNDHKDVRFYRLDKDLLGLEIGDLLSFATTPDSTIKGWDRAICIDREQPREGEDLAAMLLAAAQRPKKVNEPKPAPEPEAKAKAKRLPRRCDLQREVHEEHPDAGNAGWTSRSYLAKVAAKSQATPLPSPMGTYSEDAAMEWLSDLPSPSASPPAATEESRIALHAAAHSSDHRRVLLRQRPAHETYHAASEDVPPPVIESQSTGWTAGGYLRRQAAVESEDDDKERPKTTSVVARRLVLSHLDVKLTRSKQNEERKFWGRKPVLGGMRADGFKDEEVDEYGPNRREKLDRSSVEPVKAEVPMERSKRMFSTAVQQAKSGERALTSGGDDDDLLWIRPGFAKKLEASRRKESPPAEKAECAEDKGVRTEREGRRAARPGGLFGQVLQKSVPRAVDAAPREPSPEVSRAPARVTGCMRGWDDASADSRTEDGRGPSHARGEPGAPWKAESSGSGQGWQGKSWSAGWESNTWDSRGWSNS